MLFETYLGWCVEERIKQEIFPLNYFLNGKHEIGDGTIGTYQNPAFWRCRFLIFERLAWHRLKVGAVSEAAAEYWVYLEGNKTFSERRDVAVAAESESDAGVTEVLYTWRAKLLVEWMGC